MRQRQDRGGHLWRLRGGAVFGVAVAFKVKGTKGADVAHARDVHREVAHKGQDGGRALGQREVQHERREDNARHLLQKQQRLKDALTFSHARSPA